MKFTKGIAIIKQGNKTTAKVIDKAARNLEFKRPIYNFCRFPYSVEMLGGAFDCTDLNECNTIIEKYSQPVLF